MFLCLLSLEFCFISGWTSSGSYFSLLSIFESYSLRNFHDFYLLLSLDCISSLDFFTLKFFSYSFLRKASHFYDTNLFSEEIRVLGLSFSSPTPTIVCNLVSGSAGHSWAICRPRDKHWHSRLEFSVSPPAPFPHPTGYHWGLFQPLQVSFPEQWMNFRCPVNEGQGFWVLGSVQYS